MGQVIGKAQLNVLLPTHIQRTVRLRWLSEGISPAETVLHALCETYGWTPDETPQPIDGQLTVDETQATDESSAPQTGLAGRRAPASRRPRAADKAERIETQQSGTVNEPGTDGAPRTVPADRTNDAVPSSREPDGAVEEGAAGCPECAGIMVDAQCQDCGYSEGPP